MPSAQMLVRQANGTQIVLSPEDRIVKEITISCESGRCASRHGQDKPVTFVFNDQDPFPETGDGFMNIILPDRSPSNTQAPKAFCSAQCTRDWLVYEYVAPGPRFAPPEPNPLTAEQLAGLNSEERATVPPPEIVQNCTKPFPDVLWCCEYHKDGGFGSIPCPGITLTPEPTVIGQADGAGE